FLVIAAFGGAAGAELSYVCGNVPLAMVLVAIFSVLPLLWLTRIVTRPLRALLRAMSSAVASYRDGDFSVSLLGDRNDEVGDLLTAHNELGSALREQRAHLVERELLLETITQNSPVALLLIDSHD